MSRVCGVCGAPCRPPFAAPPAELAPDLDLRPGEPTRSTLARWMLTCRGCGLSAPDLVEPPPGAREGVTSAAYMALAGGGAEGACLRHAWLCEAGGEKAEAAQSVLQAAWLRDDAGTDATALRLRAAGLWGGGATMQDALRVLDLLRRAGAFAEAGVQAAGLLARAALTETDRLVVAYQQDLVAAGDTSRHLMSSALRPPAQRPHVTHGRAAAPARRGFWARLTGG